jgi:amino acid adenylation domain-containing protein
MCQSLVTNSSQTKNGNKVCPTNPFVEFKREEIEQTIANRFEQQVLRYPHHVAIKTRNHTFSYSELNRMANRVAHAIICMRAAANKPVALIAESDAPMIAAILGVLKTGKAYVPLDLSLPQSRIKYIIEDSQADILVASNNNLSVAAQLAQKHIRLIDVHEVDAGFSDENPALEIAPDAIAWILYTSGTSGEPKGVLQTHRGELHNIMCVTNSHHFAANDRMTLLRNPSLGGAIRNLFSALLNGVSLFPLDIKQEGLSGLADWLRHHEITIYHSSASLFRKFAQTLTGREQFPKLRLLRIGSEPVTWQDVELYKRYFSSECILVNALSSTEARTFLQYFINKKTSLMGEALPVGYPVQDLDVLLLDDDGRRVGREEIGEIVIRSSFLFPGYWQRPKLTRDSLLPDPDGGEHPVFHTGDLGRILSNGAYEHHGRKDFVVKVRGHRVQIDEVERALRGLPEVDQAVVVAQNWLADKRLVGYIVPRQGQEPKIRDLRLSLEKILPDCMVPAVFVSVESLPLTPSGKVDRNALPAPGRTRPEATHPFVRVRTPIEEVLTQQWAHALDLEEIGVEDNFFELGGNSLMASDVTSRISKIFSIQLPPYVLLEGPTVAKLAEFLVTKSMGPEAADRTARTWLSIATMKADEVREMLEKERKARDDAD